MDLRVRHFPDADAALWSRRGFRITMVMEYVQTSSWPVSVSPGRSRTPTDFVVSKVTPTIEANLGYKLFMLFATINIGGMAVFAL